MPGSVNVVLRVRPLVISPGMDNSSNLHTNSYSSNLPTLPPIHHLECCSEEESSLVISGSNITVSSSMRPKTFTYPSSIITGIGQEGISAIVSPALDDLNGGRNVTLLAYGQTGSGKTHTLFGPPGSLSSSSINVTVPERWGVMPKMLHEMVSSGSYFSLSASAVEVYFENAYDLLNGRNALPVGSSLANEMINVGHNRTAMARGSGKGNLSNNGIHPASCRCGDCWKAKEKRKKEMMEKRDSGFFKAKSALSKTKKKKEEEFHTVGETLIPVKNYGDIALILSTVEATRCSSRHSLNERSSRSHAVVKIYATRKAAGGVVRNCLTFVDLAGSERIKKSEVEGEREREARSINSSLTVLGRVVKALGRGENHVPFRDSTLTKILRGVFSGKGSRIGVVVCLSAERQYSDESLCSCRFGERMSAVRNDVETVQVQDVAIERDFIRRKLEDAKKALGEMERNGEGERFVEGSNPSEIKSFLENKEKLSRVEEQIAPIRIRYAESKGPTSRESPQDVKRILDGLLFERDNLRDIILRQRSIKNFVVPEKKRYTVMRMKVKQLQQQIDVE